MISSRFIRRIQKTIFTPVFTIIISVLTIGILIAAAIILKPKTSDQKTPNMVSPQVVQDLVVKLISLPSTATDSATPLTELSLKNNPPFQVMNLIESGALSELNLSASTSAEAIIFVNQSLPDQQATANLYGYWKNLKQQAIPIDCLFLSNAHIGLQTSHSLVVFGAGDPVSNLATLQQIRSHSTMTLTGALIDLRFDKPVISQNQISIE